MIRIKTNHIFRALDLLYGMVSRKNIMEIVKKLMEHVDAAEGSYYRDELLSRIISICSHNNYQFISNFEWYISVLVELTKVEGSKHGVLIAQQVNITFINHLQSTYFRYKM
jgi:AP-3 complex subunit delta-1